MEIDLAYLDNKFLIKEGLVIHAGANLCQEREMYRKSSFAPVIWVEAIPKYVDLARDILAEFDDQSIIAATLWSEPGVAKEFRISSNDGLSSSLYKLKWHRALQPFISLDEKINVTTTTIDNLMDDLNLGNQNISLLVLDLQGAELEALKGAVKTLQRTLAIHCEVSRIQLYKSQPTFSEIDEFLISLGFVLVKHDLEGENYSGDALYIRREFVSSDLTYKVPEDLRRVNMNLKNSIKYRLVQIGLLKRLSFLRVR